MTEIAAKHTIRRVVTRVDEQDKAVVLFDGLRDGIVRPGRGAITNVIWSTDRTPGGISSDDAAARQAGIAPVANGTVFRILDYPPASQLAPATGGSHPPAARVSDEPEIRGLPPRHPGMHRTKTLDYVVVLSGEIFMLLDDSEIHLRQGDVLVQQATNHAWVNRGTENCRIAIVLVDSEAP